jgi:hypothetical protein
MAKKTKKTDNIGCVIAQRITAALTLMGISYDDLSKVVYKECSDIAKEQKLGDWLEMPNGSTYTLTFKPNQKPPDDVI